MEQVINSTIFKKIEGIKIKKILSEDRNKFVIVIDIPQSDCAPHQVHKDSEQRRYYKRNGSTTRQMENYEIEDLFSRRKKPILQIGLRNISEVRDKPTYEVYIENIGKAVAEQTYIKLILPQECCIDNWETEIKSIFGYVSYERVLRNNLVYPKLKQVIGIIHYPKKFDFGKLKLNFIIACKEMEILEGELSIDYTGKQEVSYKCPTSNPYNKLFHDYAFDSR